MIYFSKQNLLQMVNARDANESLLLCVDLLLISKENKLYMTNIKLFVKEQLICWLSSNLDIESITQTSVYWVLNLLSDMF